MLQKAARSLLQLHKASQPLSTGGDDVFASFLCCINTLVNCFVTSPDLRAPLSLLPSVMTAWPTEEAAILNMIDRFGEGTFSIVMDSYDYANALSEV